jgi:ribose transport system substrate-binding protein
MRKISLVLLSILLVVLLLAACGSPSGGSGSSGGKELKKIAVVHYLQAWQMYQIMTGFLQEACDAEGIEMVVVDANLDANKQLQLIETQMNSGVDGIIVITLDGPTLEDVAKRCADKGIAFTSLFTEVENASCNMYVDEYDYGYQIGKLGAEYYAKNFPGEAIETGLLRMHDYLPGIQRGEGMRQAVADVFPTGVIVNDQHSVDVESAMSSTEAILAGNPDTKMFLTDSDDTGAIGAYEVLKARVAAADQDKYCVIGSDGTMQAFGYIAENSMYRGTIALDMKAIADDLFKVTVDTFYGNPFEPKLYVTYEAVGPDNVADWIKKYESVM